MPSNSQPLELLRRDPFRLLFPLGALLSWAGVSQWLLFALGWTSEYRNIFHALVQIEGFLGCFASGFLLTFIPRRTRTAPASLFEIALAAVLPCGVAVFAWLERWAISQMFWMALLLLFAQFAARRMARARNAVPPAFVWVPIAFVCGFGGAVIAGVGAARGEDWMWLHDIGRALVLQGVFSGLVLGTGSFLLPAITRGQAPADAAPGQWRAMAFHLSLGAAFIASFWIESLRASFGLRAAVCLLALAPSRPWKLPTLTGLHRRIVWVAQWMLPLGYAFVAVFPEWRRIGLHIVFIGSFAALVLAVSIHVTLSHSSRVARLHEAPLPLSLMAALLALALAARLLVDLDPARVLLWMGVASGAFLAATLAWAALLWPAIRGGGEERPH